MITLSVGESKAAVEMDCSIEELMTLSTENMLTRWLQPAVEVVKNKLVEDTLLGVQGRDLLTPIPRLEADVISLVVILQQENEFQGTWHVFEGTCKPQNHTFKVINPIKTFTANNRNIKRPPTEVLNFVAAAAQASGLPIWIP